MFTDFSLACSMKFAIDISEKQKGGKEGREGGSWTLIENLAHPTGGWGALTLSNNRSSDFRRPEHDSSTPRVHVVGLVCSDGSVPSDGRRVGAVGEAQADGSVWSATLRWEESACCWRSQVNSRARKTCKNQVAWCRQHVCKYIAAVLASETAEVPVSAGLRQPSSAIDVSK